MTKLILTKRMVFCTLLLLGGVAAADAQEAGGKDTDHGFERKQTLYKPNYWYVTGEFFSPMIFDDLYSWTKEKYHFGKGGSLKLGYQFSPIWGLEVSGAYGFNKVSPNSYQRDYVLGMDDAYTYYPYTEIDGTVYTYPVTDLFGEQGKHNRKELSLTGVGFDKIVSKVCYKQLAVNAVLNLTQLFSRKPWYKERPVELIVRPGVYLAKFDSRVELVRDAVNLQSKETVKAGSRVAPNVNRKLTCGLGGDFSVRFNLSHRWALDLTNRLVWEADHTMDGIKSAKRAYDSFVWAPAVGLTYKFRGKAEPRPEMPYPAPVPAAPYRPIAFPELFFTTPDAPQKTRIKERKHSAKIYLTYPLNKTYIVSDLHNNPTELAKLDTEIGSFLTNSDYTIMSVKIEGFASPEGPYDNNMRLASGRAGSLIDYIVGRTDLSRGMFTLGRMTENWDGLRDTLQKDASIAGREKFLKLLDSTKDTEVAKVLIKRIPEYKELLANVYPHLRLSSYEIVYAVKAYQVEEAKEILKKNPKNLSPEEIYSVALDYGLDTEAGVEALDLLAKIYPTEDITFAAQGFKLMQQEQFEEAARQLEKVQDMNNDIKNILAVAYAKTGKVDQAQALFRQASVSNPDARRNAMVIAEYLAHKK